MKLRLPFLKKIMHHIAYQAMLSRPFAFSYGMMGSVLFGLLPLFQHSILVEAYDYTTAQAIMLGLSLGLLVLPLWPHFLQRFFPFYWYMALLSVPVFSMYMFLLYPQLSMENIALMFGLFFLLYLTDWLSFALLLPMGIGIGVTLYYSLHGTPTFALHSNAFHLLISYGVSLLIGILLSYQKERREQSLYHHCKNLTHSIIQEMQSLTTATIEVGKHMHYYLPKLFTAYDMAKANHLAVPLLDEEQQKILKSLPDRLDIVNRRNTITIDMMLTTLQDTRTYAASHPMAVYAMDACVQHLLDHYPFDRHEKNLITIQTLPSFHFWGHPDLASQVFYQLLKLSFHHIRATGKGSMTLTSEATKHQNKMIFILHANTISERALFPLVRPFAMASHYDFGTGLAFCKKAMESMGGDIVCRYNKGEKVEFILSFPKI